MSESPNTVDALIEGLQRVLLPGRRRRVTAEIERWGEANHPGLGGDELLTQYNAAVDEGKARAGRLLREEIKAGDFSVVLGLLNRTGTTDEQRILALDALKGNVPADRVPDL